MKADFNENFTIVVESHVLFSDNLVELQRENKDIYFLDNVKRFQGPRFYRVKKYASYQVEIRLNFINGKHQ